MANTFIYLASPSTVENSRSTSQSATTISIRWERPDDGGRDDLCYIIEYRPQGSLGSFIMEDPIEDTGVMAYTYTIRNLKPNTNYLITVTAENGVSDQEPDLRGTRTVQIRALTLEGGESSTEYCILYFLCTSLPLVTKPWQIMPNKGSIMLCFCACKKFYYAPITRLLCSDSRCTMPMNGIKLQFQQHMLCSKISTCNTSAIACAGDTVNSTESAS